MKFLTSVTITGADDAVDVCDLEELSAEFPFVEWGVLLSAKKQGHARYPSQNWLKKIASLSVRKSLHVCGEYAKGLMAGNYDVCHYARSFGVRRIQVNGWAASKEFVGVAPLWEEFEFVLQSRDSGGFYDATRHARFVNNHGGRASVLWDPSGGRGIYGAFERLSLTDVPTGYAGGIGPDNIAEVLVDLADRGPCWIDMESNVRTSDRLDLAKVRRVLEAAAPYSLGVCGRAKVAP